MGQTTKKIRTVIGTKAKYNASPSSYAQDIYYATDTHEIIARGTTMDHQNNYRRLLFSGSIIDQGSPSSKRSYLLFGTTSQTFCASMVFDMMRTSGHCSQGQYLVTVGRAYDTSIGSGIQGSCVRFGHSNGGEPRIVTCTVSGMSGTYVALEFPYMQGKTLKVYGSVMGSMSFQLVHTPEKTVTVAATVATGVNLLGAASSAVKLQAARKLWGQSFDGQADVSGDMTGVGKLSATGEVVSTAQNAFRLAAGNYGVILRNDGAQFYFLLTAKGQAAAGEWNNLRPFFINLQTGLVTMQNGLAVNGGLSANTASVSGDLHVGGNIDCPQVAHARLLIPYELYSLATGTQLADSHFASTEWKTLAGFKTALEKFSQYGTAVYVELGNSSSNTRRTQAVFQYRENTAGKYYTFAFSTSTSNVGDLSARLQFNLTKSTGVLQFGKSGV